MVSKFPRWDVTAEIANGKNQSSQKISCTCAHAHALAQSTLTFSVKRDSHTSEESCGVVWGPKGVFYPLDLKSR